MENKKITDSIEGLEHKADEILEDAKKKAEDILINAKIEAERILISEPLTDSIDARCHEIIEIAGKDATKTKKSYKKQCDDIKANADKKITKIIDNIVNIIIGTEHK